MTQAPPLAEKMMLGSWSAEVEAAALGAAAIVVAVVVAAVVAIVIVMVIAKVGVVVVVELASWTKREQDASLAGLVLWPCPSPHLAVTVLFLVWCHYYERTINKEKEFETNVVYLLTYLR